MSKSEPFDAILRRYESRRQFLKSTGLAAAGAGAFASSAKAVPGDGGTFKGIDSIPTSENSQELTVAINHTPQVLLSWGDPIKPGVPEFNPEKQSAKAQAGQFGNNCDFVGFFEFEGKKNEGLLVVNHEYNIAKLMFPGFDPKRVTKEEVGVMMAAVGLSVVEIKRDNKGQWSVKRGSRFNRRITANTPTVLSGPALGNAWVPKQVAGTMNNCSAGKTPWGTVLSGEENFQDAFAHAGRLEDSDLRKQIHLDSYGLSEKETRYDSGWHRVHPDRFDVSKDPNAPFGYGWVVEVDPFEPDSKPVKRTALGRMRHEACTFAEGRVPGKPSARKAVLYTGDDQRFQCVYKFVSEGEISGDRSKDKQLLDHGTLYVARFDDKGKGKWLPLEHGVGPLTKLNGFSSPADVMIDTRRAAKMVGGTLMDRPEDIETNPTTGKVYVVLTNNTERTEEQTNPANPRPNNKWGHIIEISEANGDHAATAFEWDMFLEAGPPHHPDIANPDNVCFDPEGTLWVATDGAQKSIGANDGLFSVPVAGPEKGKPRQFLSAPLGAEVCGPEFTPDGTTLFVAIQHPGEGSSYEAPSTSWPGKQGPPRPSVVAITRDAHDGSFGGEPVGS